MTRDYVTEVRIMIDNETSGGPYSSPVLASEIVSKLRATDPELLAGWLDVQAQHFMRMAINDIDRHVRSDTRRRMNRESFREASEAHESGDSESLIGLMSMPFWIQNGTRARLGDLKKNDLLFVSEDFRQRSYKNGLVSAFTKALANKVGTGRVKDHFTEQQLSEMYRSIGH